jgi:hypothetical protein
MLKLAAGILGVSFDTLAHRDARNRQKELLYITGALATIAILLAVFSGYAFYAEKQAVLAQKESESVQAFLVEMMAAASPLERGRDLTVVEMLDRGRGTIDSAFDGQLLVAARMRKTMGTVYRELGFI